MPRFRIPGPLRRLSNGEITVEVGGADLGSAIVALDERYPGFRDRLLDERGDLRQFVNVYLNDEDVRLGSGLSEKVNEGDEISIVPAVAGGSPGGDVKLLLCTKTRYSALRTCNCAQKTFSSPPCGEAGRGAGPA